MAQKTREDSYRCDSLQIRTGDGFWKDLNSWGHSRINHGGVLSFFLFFFFFNFIFLFGWGGIKYEKKKKKKEKENSEYHNRIVAARSYQFAGSCVPNLFESGNEKSI